MFYIVQCRQHIANEGMMDSELQGQEASMAVDKAMIL